MSSLEECIDEDSQLSHEGPLCVDHLILQVASHCLVLAGLFQCLIECTHYTDTHRSSQRQRRTSHSHTDLFARTPATPQCRSTHKELPPTFRVYPRISGEEPAHPTCFDHSPSLGNDLPLAHRGSRGLGRLSRGRHPYEESIESSAGVAEMHACRVRVCGV